MEHVLNRGLRYVSGAEWLGTNLLRDRWVLAVSGTHGKTTTTSMLAWILDHAGLDPGYLIGGAPKNFDRSARLGQAPYFVVEADEYDTSYFDRRSKFLHYQPRTLVINNLEHDHADIFKDVDAAKAQFHQLLRSVPGEGLIIAPSHDGNINDLLRAGCWTPVTRVGALGPTLPLAMDNGEHWTTTNAIADYSAFDVALNKRALGRISWPMLGLHNASNAFGRHRRSPPHAGVPPELAIEALTEFSGVKRRLEVIAEVGETTLYDDFAHHPTAIRNTLQGLRNRAAVKKS